MSKGRSTCGDTPKAQQVGEIFSVARPKMAALIHIVTPSRPGFPPIKLEDVKARAEEFYDGSIVIAEDLMRFEISDDINVVAPNKTSTAADSQYYLS